MFLLAVWSIGTFCSMSIMNGIYWPPKRRLLEGMESQKRWVATGDLERNKRPSKSLGSGLWILVKIKPLKCKDSFRVLGFVHFQWLQQKLRQCIPLLKGYNLRMIVWNFAYCTDSETNLMWKCGCTHTRNGFHIGDTWSCALPVKFLRFVWVGSAVSMLCWVYTPIVQCVPHPSEEAWNLGCKTKHKSPCPGLYHMTQSNAAAYFYENFSCRLGLLLWFWNHSLPLSN